MSRKTELTELHKKGKAGAKIDWEEYEQFLRDLAHSYKQLGNLPLAAQFKRWAQSIR